MRTKDEWMKLIREALTNEDAPLAYSLADESAQEYPDSEDIWAVNAYLYLWQGRREDAEAAVARAVKLNSDSALARGAQAYVAAFEARSEEAVEAAERAIQLDASNPWVLQWCVDVFTFAGDNDRAIELASRWAAEDPHDQLALSELMNILLSSGKTAEAQSVLADAEQRFPNSPMVYHKRSRMLVRAGRLREAIQVLESGAKCWNGSFTLWAELAQALALAKRDRDAEVAARRALELCPCSPIAFRAMANVYTQRGKKKEAARWQLRALTAIPAMSVMMSLGSAVEAIKQANWPKVLTLIEPALSAPSTGTRRVALNMQGTALLELERFDEAVSVVEEIQKLSPGEHSTYKLSATLKEKMHRTEEAIDIYREGLEHYPHSGALRAGLLRIYREMHNEHEAETLAKEAFSCPPENPAGMYALIPALTDSGYSDAARRMLAIAKDRFPEDEMLRLLEAVDLLDTGRVDAAVAAASTVKGEWRGIGRLVLRGASFIKRFARWAYLIKNKRFGSGPPTEH